ncbi:MAG: RsmD family RNA methyltransferase [Elusimicrobia bacterium]|nr:RsmD family RNA methyltransferase [Elusimicrobiota bacterium]
MSLRILSGRLKGREVASVPADFPLRPISSRMKKSLFDILRPLLPGACFLELFSGTGSVGLEAASLGAKKVFFVDKDPLCAAVAEKNIRQLSLADCAEVCRFDVLQGLAWLPYRLRGERVDFVFMGPPYRDVRQTPLFYVAPVLRDLARSEFLKPDAWVIAQHHKKEIPEIPGGWELFRRNKYGDSFISFFRRER